MANQHFLDGEQILSEISTGSWTWYATNQRIIKHQDTESDEILHDLSYDEISGISLETKEKTEYEELEEFGLKMVYYPIICIPFIYVFNGWAEENLIDIVLSTIGISSQQAILILAVIVTTGILFLIKFPEKDHVTFFQFRGDGLIQSEKSRWRIHVSDDRQQTADFVKSVREQINKQ
jgi:hypothetical protein